jgi:uncharacterized protein (TIGR00369 family)
MLPEHANPLGNVHGGALMKLVDEAGAICAMRHARRACVTVAVDSMAFYSPVRVGELVTCSARVHYVGRTSIEVGVNVRAENVLSGDVTHTNSARVVYVALDDRGQPASVPGLVLETDDERRRFEAARQRHEEAREQRQQATPSRP